MAAQTDNLNTAPEQAAGRYAECQQLTEYLFYGLEKNWGVPALILNNDRAIPVHGVDLENEANEWSLGMIAIRDVPAGEANYNWVIRVSDISAVNWK
jgi:hypothetical protein